MRARSASWTREGCRGGGRPIEFLGAREARWLVVSEPYDDSPERRSFIRRNLALRLDGHFVPLAVADQSIFMRLNEAAASTRGEQHVGAWPLIPILLRLQYAV
jgi:hypothetical protein